MIYTNTLLAFLSLLSVGRLIPSVFWVGALDERGFCQRVRDEVYLSEEKCKVEIGVTYPQGEWK